jgi:hypothetical protein
MEALYQWDFHFSDDDDHNDDGGWLAEGMKLQRGRGITHIQKMLTVREEKCLQKNIHCTES